MKTLRRFFFNLPAMLALLSCSGNHDYIGLTLVPPGRVTDKVDLDIRAGVVNNGDADKTYICILATMLTKTYCSRSPFP